MNSTDPYQITPDMDLTTFYKTISAKGKEVMKQKKAQGEVMHLAPLGFKNARDDQGRSIVVPDPKNYLMVLEARRLRAEGMSIRVICRHMKNSGLRSQRGKAIGPSSMQKILLRGNYLDPASALVFRASGTALR